MRFRERIVFCIVVGWCTVSTALAEELQSYPGYTGVYPGFTLAIDDRFDAFDEALWRRGDGAVGGEALCRFQPQGVQIRDGLLELVIRKESVPASFSRDQSKDKGPYPYSCGELRTQPKHRVRYGRIEARMKAPARGLASGYISSLFTYRNEANTAGKREWEEIDVELEGGRPDKFQANLIYGLNMWDWPSTRAYGAWEDKIDIAPVDAWRVYAIEWLPDQIRWYVDGVLVKTLAQQDIDCSLGCRPPQKIPTPIPNDPADIMVNFWIPVDGIQDVFGGNKQANVYPMVSQYDWLRYYRFDGDQRLENGTQP